MSPVPTVEIRVSGLRKGLSFEGRPIIVVRYSGMPCVPSAHVGEILGYSDSGKTLAKVIHKDWRDDFVLGTHYDVLRGPELHAFKHKASRTEGSLLSPATKALTVLYPKGVELIATKTGRDVGRRLTTFLDEIAPTLEEPEPVVPLPVMARPDAAPWWWVEANRFTERCVAAGLLTEREALVKLAPIYRDVLGIDVPV